MTLENVSEEQPLEKEAVSEEVQAEEKETLEEQPKAAFPEEQEARIQQLIAQAVEGATKQAMDAGRRQLQSEQDRNKSERRAREQAEARLRAFDEGLVDLDDDTRAKLENAQLRERLKQYESSTQEETQRQATEAYFKSIEELREGLIEKAGVSKEDSRIQWGNQDDDLVSGLNKFASSLVTIQKEENDKMLDSLKKEFDEKILKVRVDAGLEDTNKELGGGGDTSDESFVRGMEDGSLPLTPENEARLLKIQGIQ